MMKINNKQFASGFSIEFLNKFAGHSWAMQCRADLYTNSNRIGLDGLRDLGNKVIVMLTNANDYLFMFMVVFILMFMLCS